MVLEGGYRQSYFDHHRQLGTPRDPELAYRSLEPYRAPVSNKKIIAWFLLDLACYGITALLTGFWAVFRIRSWFEHVGLERAGKEGTHRFVANPALRFLFFQLLRVSCER